ncbi:alanine racemase [Calditrichota bacterium]
MFTPSTIELSRSALKKNLSFLRRIIGKHPRFSSVIKGNAYGHGIETFVPLAEECGIRHFSVFSDDEALRTLNCRTQSSEVMIMASLANQNLKWAIENDISFYVYGLDRIEKTVVAASEVGKPARIHLELETGLNRMGFDNDSLNSALEIIKRNSNYIEVVGVCSHLAGAESFNNYFRIVKQIKVFNSVIDCLKENGVTPEYRHLACSAAIFNFPETIYDMVRVGIAQYGFWPTEETRMHYLTSQKRNSKSTEFREPLVRVLKWKSRIINIKTVEAGEFIGYGSSYQTTRKQKIASVPVGYYHGFSRNLSNNGQVLVKGKLSQVVGVVNMNMLMVNVTDIRDLDIGEEVVIIGKQGRSQVSVSSFSDLANNLNYEVLVSLQSDIPRIVVD